MLGSLMMLLLAVNPAMFMVRRSRILSCVLNRRSHRLALQNNNFREKILKNKVSGVWRAVGPQRSLMKFTPPVNQCSLELNQ